MDNQIWKYDRGRYRVYTENKLLRDVLKKRKDCKLSNRYDSKNSPGWDFIFPKIAYIEIKQIVKQTAKSPKLS